MAPPPSYHPVLLRLMGFLDNVTYAKGTAIERDRILELTPQKLMRWFNNEVYGEEDPEDDAKPNSRSSSIEFWKKALSHFMCNKLMAWNEISNVGNPTRSTELNELIKQVKKAEVRKQGIPSKARRALTHSEYVETHDVLKRHQRTVEGDSTNAIWNYGCVASLNFQFHLIARIDDTMHVKMENVKQSTSFSYLLQTRLNWSKNVREERDAPWQLMLPSMNSIYCVYISLALWLEVFISKYPHAALTPYLFGFSQDTREQHGADLSKAMIQSILGGTIFKATNALVGRGVGAHGPLGTHSVRKLASTHSRKCGGTKDDRDTRGRWKGKARVGDRYDDVELPWPDVKVASMLCLGGPCKYVVRANSGVTDEFILRYVMPSSRQRISEEVSKILGTALLFFIFEDSTNHIPEDIVTRVRNAYAGVSNDPTQNPVARVPVVCTCHEGEVYIDTIASDEDLNNLTAEGDNNIGTLNDRPMRDQVRALQSQLMGVKAQLEDISKLIKEENVAKGRQLQALNANIKRIGLSPARPIRQTIGNTQSATLSAHPRTLYELWDEYVVGIGGRKPAREFTAKDRGRLKYKYYRRKKLWDLVCELTRGGLTHHVAIDRVYQVYGRRNSVTNIIAAIKRDGKNNFIPPLLRV